MWHSRKSSDVRSKRFKIVVALATGLCWMSSGTVRLSRASAESLSVPAQPTPSLRSAKKTRKLTRRPSEDQTSTPSSQLTSPSTSSNQTQNKLIRLPSKPQVPAPSSPSTATVKSSDKTPIASSAGSGTAPIPGSSSELATSTKAKTTAQPGTAIGSVTVPTTVPSSQSPRPSASANLAPQASASPLSAVAPSGSPSGSSIPRKLTQRPEVAGILAQPPPPPPPVPTIGLSPTSLSFTGAQGGANPSAKTVNMTNSGGGTMSWSAGSNAGWLILTASGPTAPGTLTASVNLASLAVGTYNTTITVTATGATNTPQTLPVALTVSAAPPTIGLGPSSLTFTGVQGGANPTSQTLSFTNTGGGTLSWSVSDNAGWLTLSPASGTAPGTATATVSTSGLTAGIYNGTITVTATGATNTPQTLPVTLTVTAAPVPPTIGLSPTSLSFTGVQGGTNPANQTLNLTNTGGSTLNWSVSDTATWLTLSPTSGTAPGSATASVNLTGLTAGTYNATITVTATGATNTPQTVPLTLTVTAAPPTIGLSLTSILFTGVQSGANPTNQTLSFTNTGGGTLNWSVSDNSAWLTLSPASGTVPGSTTMSVNTSGLTAGTYNATITVTATGATNTPRTVPVTLTVTAPPTSGTATLTWNASTSSDVAGYKVYLGTASGVYGPPTSVGNVITSQVTNLQSGTTYFFAVTAVDTSGNESTFSNEVSKSIF
ncbi:MAG: hypothetical protein E6K69_03110 [Nitrospirae bacterium]|nr:MAG: hypothetical protein E6K69_03110 [Nitrospirota bacterium]